MAKMSRSAVAKKAWITRKANAKKRGVKPGTKRGKYHKLTVTPLNGELKIGDTISFHDPGPAVGDMLNISSTLFQLETAIDDLIQRINGQTNRIKDMM